MTARSYLRVLPMLALLPVAAGAGCAARKVPPLDAQGAEVEMAIAVDGERWTPVASLASSAPGDRHYQVQVDRDGRARINFGDGVHGQRPPVGSTITVSYRGGGVAGDMSRTATATTTDRPLWVVVRDRTQAVSFERDAPPCEPACRCDDAAR